MLIYTENLWQILICHLFVKMVPKTTNFLIDKLKLVIFLFDKLTDKLMTRK